MVVHFNLSSPFHGKITKESKKFGDVPITVDDARDAWQSGQITDCNIAFHRLAVDFDFDVAKCLKWYREQD